jgi:cytidylate kinase
LPSASFRSRRPRPSAPSCSRSRLGAPLQCRIATDQREHLVDHACAEKAIKRDDRVKSAWVRSLYRVEIDDDRNFTLALDTSRFSPARVVEILLAAGGVQAALVAT